MDAEPLPEAELCAALQKKLQRWGSLGEAPEYFALRNRGPHKATISHPLNRFGGNMGPYADSLLPLKSVEYINASPIDNIGDGAPWFVATMCPKRETFAHFWSMVWELGTRVIVNLTHERDRVGSGPSDKRERYWPPLDPTSEAAMARWPVQPRTLFTESCEQVPSLVRYAIELRGPPPADGGQRPTRVVALYWYSRWVDFPSSTSIGARPFYANAWAVLHIALHVAGELEDLGPKHWTVCHCSAGVGRTGTFVALLHLLSLLPKLHSESEVDSAIATTIEAMRDRRLWMVKTDIEFATIYAALLLRLRNPDAADFALTWPLSDGGRSDITPRDQSAADANANAKVAGKAEAPTASAMAVDTAGAEEARLVTGSDGGSSAAADANADATVADADAATSDEGSARMAADMKVDMGAGGGMEDGGRGAAVAAVSAASGSAGSGGETAVSESAGVMAGGALEVRTPEDDEMEVEKPSGPRGEADYEEVDNSADVAHYAGVGEGGGGGGGGGSAAAVPSGDAASSAEPPADVA